jgi:hypothetical protein
MTNDTRTFRVLLQLSILEVDRNYPATERVWAEERVVVPLERIAALDAQAMVDRAVRNVVHIAGQTDQPEEPEEEVPVIPAFLKHRAAKKA